MKCNFTVISSGRRDYRARRWLDTRVLCPCEFSLFVAFTIPSRVLFSFLFEALLYVRENPVKSERARQVRTIAQRCSQWTFLRGETFPSFPRLAVRKTYFRNVRGRARATRPCGNFRSCVTLEAVCILTPACRVNFNSALNWAIAGW